MPSLAPTLTWILQVCRVLSRGWSWAAPGAHQGEAGVSSSESHDSVLGEGQIYLTFDPGAAAPQTVWLPVGFQEMFCGVPLSLLSLVGGVQM